MQLIATTIDKHTHAGVTLAALKDTQRLDAMEKLQLDLHCNMSGKWTSWANGEQLDEQASVRAAIDAAIAAAEGAR